MERNVTYRIRSRRRRREGIEVMRVLMTIESIFSKRHLRYLSKEDAAVSVQRVNIPNRL